MLALNRAIEQIKLQLKGFSGTAKLLIAALMVILVMGLIIVATYAGRAEMVSLSLDAH